MVSWSHNSFPRRLLALGESFHYAWKLQTRDPSTEPSNYRRPRFLRRATLLPRKASPMRRRCRRQKSFASCRPRRPDAQLARRFVRVPVTVFASSGTRRPSPLSLCSVPVAGLYKTRLAAAFTSDLRAVERHPVVVLATSGRSRRHPSPSRRAAGQASSRPDRGSDGRSPGADGGRRLGRAGGARERPRGRRARALRRRRAQQQDRKEHGLEVVGVCR